MPSHRSIAFAFAFAASCVLLSTFASTTAAAAETEAASPSGAYILPREVDVKASVRTSPVLQYGGIGASGDLGVTRIGPGTFAVGGSLAYEACVSSCWGMPYDLSQHQTWLEGRASYHLQAPHIGYLDLYPLFTVGVAFAGSTIHVADTTEYKGSSIAPTVGFGGGASYFFSHNFFVSGEATLRYAGGTYDYELARGPARPHDGSRVDSWSANTIALAIGAGARF